MIENNPTKVSSAFEMLLEEVEAEIDFVNCVGAKAFDGRDYYKAKEAMEGSGTLTAFRDQIAALRKEWEEIAAAAKRETFAGSMIPAVIKNRCIVFEIYDIIYKYR